MLVTFFQTVGGGAAVQDRAPELDSGAAEPDRSHSNSSTLSDRRLSSSSLCSVEEEHRAVYEMVQRILLSTRGYVNFVNEVFRQVSAHERPCACSTVCTHVSRKLKIVVPLLVIHNNVRNVMDKLGSVTELSDVSLSPPFIYCVEYCNWGFLVIFNVFFLTWLL